MKPRLINANALMEYCQNQMDKKIDCNDIARFPTYPTDEWHYVKDGDLPKDEKDVQVLYQDYNKINLYTCLYDIHGEFWLYYNLDNMLLEPFDYKVIAWKETVPPESL